MSHCSYVIPYRESSFTRRRNLLFVLQWLSRMPEIEVLLIEQDSESRVDPARLPANCRHIFTYNPGLFNRSWGLNVGFRQSGGEVIAFADADILLLDEDLRSAFEACMQGYEAVNPFRRVIDLSHRETESLISGHSRLSRHHSYYKSRAGTNFAGGIVLFRREAYERIGGYDERFFGWGVEDDAVAQYKVPILLERTRELDFDAFHLWHERSTYDTHHQPNYSANLNIYLTYGRWEPEIHAMIARFDAEMMGNPRKFESDPPMLNTPESAPPPAPDPLPDIPVSVIMPVYNTEHDQLLEAWYSIEAQTFRPAEVLIVDDHSGDKGTLQALKFIENEGENVRLLRLRKNLGTSGAMAKGLEHCAHDVVARMDSDDIMMPERLELQVRYLDRHPEVDLLGGQILQFSAEQGVIWKSDLPEVIDKDFAARSHGFYLLNHPTVMFRKQAILDAGGYDPSLRDLPEDYELWLRCLRNGACVRNLPDILVLYRVRPDSASHTYRPGYQDFLQRIRADFERAHGYA